VSDRALKRLVGALVVTGGLWVVVSLLSGGGSGSIAASGALADFFEGVDAGTLDSLRFEAQGAPALVLSRDGVSWTVNGFPADSGSVARLLDETGDFGVGELVATNPNNHARMGVSSDSAVTATFFVDGEGRSLLVGDAGRAFGTAYVRLPGSDEVHLLDGDLRSHAMRDLDGWRNRRMVAVDTAAVARIDVERGEDAYTLTRADSAWTFAAGDSANAASVRGILSELSGLMATGFLEEGDSIAGLPRDGTTRAYDVDDRLLAEVTIGQGSGNRWARSRGDPYLYEVSAFRADRVAPPREEIEPDS